jgi:hypothetical protein
MRKISGKLPKGLALHEPLRHPDHPRPTTRRQFIAQSFMTGGATVLMPPLVSLLADPRAAHAASPTLPTDIQTAITNCGITAGAGLIPFICFDLSGGGNIMGSNVLVGGPGGQLDFLSVAGYNKLGLPGTMVPNSSATGSFVDSTFGLRFHLDSAHLRGMKSVVKTPSAMANTTGTVIPALSQNDTSNNPLNPMYGIYQVGARGALLNLIGSESSVSGGNSVAPPTMIDIAAQPSKIANSTDSQGLVNTGQLSTLLPNPTGPITVPTDVTNVLMSMKRISDAKYPMVTAYGSAAANALALGPTGIQACAYTKAAYLLNRYPSPGAIDPDVDPNIVGSSGIFSTAQYQGNSDIRKTAAVMKLVIDGDAAAGTIQLGGFDYHTGERATGETRDFLAGQCIGTCLEYAARVGKPVMIYVFSDGSLSSNGTIDESAAARGKCVWTADNQNVSASYFLVYDPKAKPQPAQSNPEMSLQLGYCNPDGSQNTTSSPAGNNVFNLVQIVVLNYMALHNASAASSFPGLYPAPNPNNTLGTGSALQSLISFQPLASLVNGKVAS